MDMREPELDLGPVADDPRVYAFASSCQRLKARAHDESVFEYLGKGEQGFEFGAQPMQASRFRMRAADLGTYLFYDEEARFLVHTDGAFARPAELESALTMLDDSFKPGARWVLQGSVREPEFFQLKHVATGHYLTREGLSERMQDAVVVDLEPAQDCATFPELTLDATGDVGRTTFDDGTLYGAVDTHSHILSNFGFGGAGIFHGSAFHPFGVEHALGSCEPFHGEEGRGDLFGYGFDNGGELDQNALLQGLVTGKTPEFNHFTDGWPTFTQWPSAPRSSTHQTQYYRWLERAHKGGLRLMIQHATSNQIICELLEGSNAQPTRYSCNDMVAVDRILIETRNMERYIDAQHGGPGKGWFRIVESPQQAREVIAQGKMAIVLGIETSNLFDCFLVPPDGVSRCTQADVLAQLDAYEARGVRVIFPVHKHDNGFSAGDGSRTLIELGNFAQTGHYSNFTQDCPDVPTAFDKGAVTFGDLNQPRADYFGEPYADMSKFGRNPAKALLPHAGLFMGEALEGDYCQSAGMTPLGEFLLEELMRRGMVIELDHLPRRGYVRAFEMLRASDYPGAGTHGNNNRGELYELGGVSKFSIGRCSDSTKPGERLSSLRQRLVQMQQAGSYPAEGFGFDLNGFAGGTGPRFAEDEPCPTPQENPVTYPFTSFAGDVTFTQPSVGERVIDFNAEGFVHIGMMPELVEDLRHDGASDEEIEAIFRSAEGYIRMWEKAQRRGQEISTQ